MNKPKLRVRPRITLSRRITDLAAEHGGLRAAARAVKLSVPYLSRLKNGHQTNPTPEALKKLGLVRHVTYSIREPHERIR